MCIVTQASAMERHDEEFERCIRCHKLTECRRSTPVDMRKHHVDGGGEMCASCYGVTYPPPFQSMIEF